MTQSSLQTQCPKCRTRFRVTDEQLGIAKGKVRCGHCMEVFNAVDHQVAGSATGPRAGNNTPGTAGRPEHPSRERSATGFTSDIIEDDFIFADNPEEDAEEGPYAGTKLTFSEEELSDSFRDVDAQDPTSLGSSDNDDLTGDIDESWAEAILNEDSAPAKPPAEPEFDKAKPGPEPQQKLPVEPEDSGTGTPSEPPQEQADATGFYVDEQPDPAFESFASEHGDEPENEHQQNEPFTANAPFDDLRYDPVSVGAKDRSWLRSLVWSLIILGLVGVLVAQVTWFQFDRLSTIPELRPFYEKGCELAGCELKPLINIESIKSRKLVVRTNPENRSQLVVDAVIINQADFQQPFPAIALTFSNLNGDVVAQSIFTPEEYLAGEGEELDIMPVETPVRIAISIRDPGRDAVNYNISFQPYAP
ncbi:DUF3426 domain-containing protein [Marinobacter sp. F3R11]|uniref:DUF3426 domain-containing protein n=1 Tax=Marinobacter sp. F3R11 TaxID=2267231 RepID=UPI000DEA9B75|nr:DUF3426 domain-containing protein [Marinobacter sp. F3R11]RBW48988.1 DUF3426 domain-containing protein [Marinobacter sp. F3R11]